MHLRRAVFSAFNIFGNLATGLIALALGGLFLTAGLYLRRQDEAFLQRAARATGVVVDVVAVTQGQAGEEPSTYFYPVVEFVTAGGERVRFRSPEGRWPPAHRVGDEVTVLYDPALPEYAMLESSVGLRVAPVLQVVGGFFLLVAALGLLRVAVWPLRIALLAALGLWLWYRGKEDGQGRP